MTKEPLKQETIAARQEAQKEAVLAQLRKLPIVTLACERAGVSRPTFYRMRDADEAFRTAVEEAVAEGVAFVTDMSEAQLIQLIKDKNFSAIQLWLRHHHAGYANKVEIKAEVRHTAELTSEQEALIERGLRLIGKANSESDARKSS